MTTKPMSAADRAFRKRWQLAEDDPSPATLHSPLFEEDFARRLEAEREAKFASDPDEISGQSGGDSLSGGSANDQVSLPRYPSTSQRYGFDRAPNPGRIYSYGGRNYESFEAAKAANPDMVLASNPPSAAEEFRARRDKAFVDSIGASPFSLGTLSYAGGGADLTR